ncbi:hypothetical protein [Actinoplanes siamensis]|uniref:Uncharacterized protein n=1 Tax=Actinoplanes siamensis TaxID=1223317 RepID=A0A919NBG3_9ACTN|nr:hypothetical protein [Actinoplanes siamensis]GIF07816.1 hypothetical protein Asi03nite_53540 [Actinoplanes siamensis]
MRRAAVVLAVLVAGLWIAAPAQAFAHNNVHNVYFHTLLDGLTLLVVSAPVWTAMLWSGRRKWLMAALIAVVQIPVAVIGFVPIVNPYLHLTLFLLAIALTGVSLRAVRDRSRAAATAPASR